MIIIGFGHRSRTGKDTASNLVAEKLRAKYPKLNVVRAAFADKLKAVCHDLFGWAGVQPLKYYEDHPEFRQAPMPLLNNKTVIDIWVEVGNKMREIYPNIWVDYVLNIPCDILICSDCRYPNEAEKIKEKSKDSILVKMVRNAAPKLNTIADNALEGNESWYDIKFVNDGSLEELNKFVDSIVNSVDRMLMSNEQSNNQ